MIWKWKKSDGGKEPNFFDGKNLHGQDTRSLAEFFVEHCPSWVDVEDIKDLDYAEMRNEFFEFLYAKNVDYDYRKLLEEIRRVSHKIRRSCKQNPPL